MNRNKTHLFYFGIGLAVTALWGLWLLGAAGSGHDFIVSDPDAYLHTWNLWWVQEALTTFSSPYSTSFIGYPDRISLTYNQLILPLGLLSIPLFSVGFHAAQVLLIWQYTFLFVGFIGMYLLVTRITDHPAGACLSGLYFVFTPIFWENLPRPDSLSYVIFPWLILALYWAYEGPRWQLVVPGIIGAVIVLMSPYYAVGWVIVCVLTLPYARNLSLNRGDLLAVTGLSFLFSSFEWIPQALGKGPNVIVDRRVIEAFSADLTGLFLPHPYFVWIPESYAWWSETWTAGIHSSIYLGWAALALGLVGLTRLEPVRRRWILLVLVVMLTIALGPGIRVLGVTYGSGLLPYGWALAVTDAIKAFRIPLRFGYFIIFFLSLGIGYGLPRNVRWRWLVYAVVLIELVRFPMQVRELPDVKSLQTVKSRVKAPALVPVPFSDWATEAQFAQTIHRKKYHLAGLSYIPREVWDQISKNPFLDALYNKNRLPEKGLESLKKQGVGGVLYHHGILGPERRARLDADFKRLLGEPDYTTDRFRLYQFREEPYSSSTDSGKER